MALSYNGELSPSSQKKFKETLIFVPFFGGKKSSLKRHVDFVNKLGFDAVLFDMQFNFNPLEHSLISSQFKIGMKTIWADQIEKILNETPGDKIIYAFSNPSASAIEAVARRKAVDIKGLICDGGPTSNLWQSMINYFTYETPLKGGYLVKAAAATVATVAWSPDFKKTIYNDLESFPESCPVLSVRGWKDPLISPKQIDEVFEPHHHLDWRKLSLPQAVHLNGLKDYPEEYKPPVERFLTSLATATEV